MVKASLLDEDDPGSPVKVETSDGVVFYMSLRAFMAFQEKAADPAAFQKDPP